jgi:hypothetical protein
VGTRTNSRENHRCAPRRSIFGRGGFELLGSFEHLRPFGGWPPSLCSKGSHPTRKNLCDRPLESGEGRLALAADNFSARLQPLFHRPIPAPKSACGKNLCGGKPPIFASLPRQRRQPLCASRGLVGASDDGPPTWQFAKPNLAILWPYRSLDTDFRCVKLVPLIRECNADYLIGKFLLLTS